MRYNSALHIGLGPPTARWGGQVSEPTAGAFPSPPFLSLRSFPPATLGEQRKTTGEEESDKSFWFRELNILDGACDVVVT